MAMVDRHLTGRSGPCVLHPPYTVYDPAIVRLTINGCCENDNVYVHAAVFMLVADCMLGRAEQALNTLSKI
jgi:cellobiose phosphorylase